MVHFQCDIWWYFRHGLHSSQRCDCMQLEVNRNSINCARHWSVNRKTDYRNRLTLVVFKSTPTKLTHSITTSPSDSVSNFSFTSCWYMPTPMCFASIFTNSASGSLKRRAIETEKFKFLPINIENCIQESSPCILTGADQIHIQIGEFIFGHITAWINRRTAFADNAIFCHIWIENLLSHQLSEPRFSLTASSSIPEGNQFTPLHRRIAEKKQINSKWLFRVHRRMKKITCVFPLDLQFVSHTVAICCVVYADRWQLLPIHRYVRKSLQFCIHCWNRDRCPESFYLSSDAAAAIVLNSWQTHRLKPSPLLWWVTNELGVWSMV